MGSHRGEQRVRGLSKGPIFALVAIVVVAALVFGWFQLKRSVNDRGDAANNSCVEGNATLPVSVDPTIAGPVRAIADKYNLTKPIVRDHCLQVEINSQPSRSVRDALAAGGTWNQSAAGPRPSLWIPQSTESVHGVPPAAVDGDAKSIASTPVVLAVAPPLRDALTTAHVGWRDLPLLQGNDNSLTALGLQNWGGLRLALPTAPGSEPTASVLDAVATDVSNTPPGVAVTDDAANAPQVVTSISMLGGGAGAPTVKPTAAGDALTALSRQTDQAAGPIHATPVTQQQLDAAIKTGAVLAPYAPEGAHPVADYPAVVLAGDWIDDTQSRGAALFSDFLRQPAQSKTLTDAGFRIGVAPDSLKPASGPALAKLSDVLANPQLGIDTTVLLDVSSSMSMDLGSDSRLNTVVAALRAQLPKSADGSWLGLWRYGKNLDGSSPYSVDVKTAPLTDSSRQQLDTALGAATPTRNRADGTYPTLEAAYRSAVTGFVAGRTNSVLLITDGPDDDSSVTGEALLAAIAAAGDKAKPVRVNVIIVGQGSDTGTLKTLTDRTGGTLTKAATAADVTAAVTKALS